MWTGENVSDNSTGFCDCPIIGIRIRRWPLGRWPSWWPRWRLFSMGIYFSRWGGSKSVISPRLRTEQFSLFGPGPSQLSQCCWIKMHQVHWYGHEYHQKPFQGQLWLLKVFFRYWISWLTGQKIEIRVTDKTGTKPMFRSTMSTMFH